MRWLPILSFSLSGETLFERRTLIVPHDADEGARARLSYEEAVEAAGNPKWDAVSERLHHSRSPSQMSPPPFLERHAHVSLISSQCEGGGHAKPIAVLIYTASIIFVDANGCENVRQKKKKDLVFSISTSWSRSAAWTANHQSIFTQNDRTSFNIAAFAVRVSKHKMISVRRVCSFHQTVKRGPVIKRPKAVRWLGRDSGRGALYTWGRGQGGAVSLW